MQSNTKVFLITFFGYFVAHSFRASWSFSKPYLQNSNTGIGISKTYLGIADVIFMLAYAFGLTVLGPIADKMKKKTFLVFGYILCSSAFLLIGLIYWFSSSHNLTYLMILMGINGLGQSVGLPGSMGILSNYYDTKQKGLALGFWPACTNLGNIFGLIASSIIIHNIGFSWQVTFIFHSILLLFMTVAIHCFLQQNNQQFKTQDQEPQQLQIQQISEQNNVTFFSAFCLPRVLEYTVALCCVKGSIYGLLFWLPIYLNNHGMASSSGYIPSVQEIGAIFGGSLIGYLGGRYLVSFFLTPSLYVSSILLLIPRFILGAGTAPYYIIMFFLGVTLGGAYNVISTSMCIQLGTQQSIKGNKKAASTVTGVMDGTGALFTAATQLILAQSSQITIFTLLPIYCFLSAVVLTPIFYQDVKIFRGKKDLPNHEQQ